MAKKQYNLKLARELNAYIETSNDEINEIKRIFPESETALATEVFRLRKSRRGKFEIIKILSIDKYQLEKILGTIGYSQYLSLQLASAFDSEDESGPGGLAEIAPNDPVAFQQKTLENVRNKLLQLNNAITPDKMFDTDVPGLVTAIKDLHSVYRLESGQSTARIDQRIGVAHMTNPENIKAAREQQNATYKLLSEIGKQIGELDEKIERANKRKSKAKPGRPEGTAEGQSTGTTQATS